MHVTKGRLTRLLAGVAMIVAAGLAVPAPAGAAGDTGAAENYLVVFKGNSSPKDAEAIVTRAGGSVVANYAQIGVLVARSNNTAFGTTLRANNKVEGASATADFATQLAQPAEIEGGGPPAGDLPNAPATDADTFSPLQWDMRQIHTPEAHAITGGSPEVLVGDIDTGIDFTHPDLAPNIDVANSVNCVDGAPVAGLAAQDDHGHGTHTAGTIAAASNGIGIVGVAPNVRIAGIKAGNADGYFFPEAVVCAFVWAGSHHMDVTNNSYFVDPFLFNCRNDEVQRAIWKAVQRAVRYAMNEGVTVVAAEGNESEDLSHPSADVTSPDFPPGSAEERAVTNACVVLPTELPGVIGVTATGNREQGTDAGRYPDHLKAYYSSFGVSSADLAAPGGDFYFGNTEQSVTGLVLSTWPAALLANCGNPPFFVQEMGVPGGAYCYEQGTSMASPHVAGVAALVISQFGDDRNPQNGHLRPGRVEQYLEQTADPQACPEVFPSIFGGAVNYLDVTGSQGGAVQRCQGGPGHNSWYGNGEVDALGAVTHDTSNN
jgi:subtilisin family serine protease